MKCKYCQREMPEDGIFCSYCGKSNAEPEETAQAMEAVVEEAGAAEVVIGEETEAREPGALQEAEASPQLKKMKRMAVFSGCLAVLAVLGTLLFFGIRGNWDLGIDLDFKQIFWIREDSLTGNKSYTLSDKKVQSKRDEIVATLGDATLTNGELQVFYWMQVRSFLSEYGYYLSYVGLDLSKPLSEQQSIEEGLTWEQYFLEGAINYWQTNQSFALMAKENGFELSEEYLKNIEDTRTSLVEAAEKEKYASVDAMLQEEMGKGCTFEDYMSYVEIYFTGYAYFSELYDALNPTAEEIEKYFDNNEDAFKAEGITKDSGKYYSIRHLLVAVEGTKGEDGKVTYTEEDWKKCQEEAQKLLDGWIKGEVNEDTFAALAGEHSDDSNTKGKGGLYENYTKDKLKTLFGDPFIEWACSEERKADEYELIKTDYGYHIVYFVDSQDIWYAEAESALISEQGSAIVTAAQEKYTLEVDYKKIVLGNVELT